MRGFLALVLLGCGCVAPQGPGAAPARAAAFDQAQAAIARGDWEDAAVLLGRFVHRDPSHALAAHARYLLGVYYLRAGDYDAAEEEFAYVGGHA
ncbi:MAG: tetratricopeptide repeat protein, partial [Planctomycetes bacterium]|nr:tetratricopeptide repeat protein [Planctomycetota bacterium]